MVAGSLVSQGGAVVGPALWDSRLHQQVGLSKGAPLGLTWNGPRPFYVLVSVSRACDPLWLRLLQLCVWSGLGQSAKWCHPDRPENHQEGTGSVPVLACTWSLPPHPTLSPGLAEQPWACSSIVYFSYLENVQLWNQTRSLLEVFCLKGVSEVK